MSKQFSTLAAITAAVVGTAALALTPVASGASSLPTMNIALSGTKGITISGSEVSGAVRITSSFTGHAPSGPNANGPTWGLVRLNPGVTLPEAFAAVQSHHGDLNGLTPYGTLFADASAGQVVQTVLTPGSYVALNITGNGNPGFVPFTVTQSPSPAALPAARATETSIEFGFRGPSVLHDGTIVRAVNGGFLVHMDFLIGVKNAAIGRKVMVLLLAGKTEKAMRLTTNNFVGLIGPASPGAMQQQVLHAKPGYYVQACFMNTEDGREHTQLGMERLVKVVK
jgi:hypothetical protein